MSSSSAAAIEAEATDSGPDLAAALRSTMKARGWSAPQLAAHLGSDERTIRKWLAGVKPSKALCTALRLALAAGPMAEVYLHIQAALEAAQAATRHRDLKGGGGGSRGGRMALSLTADQTSRGPVGGAAGSPTSPPPPAYDSDLWAQAEVLAAELGTDDLEGVYRGILKIKGKA